MKENNKNIKKIRRTAMVFITLLALSGITAFPIQSELNLITSWFGNSNNSLYAWIYNVNEAVTETNAKYPFLAYGTDWLAFAHIIISIFFIGVYRDPVRNIWITHTGIIACLLVFPLAFLAGYLRGIPLFWQLIDCSFGALGLIPLLVIHKKTKQIILKNNQTQTY